MACGPDGFGQTLQAASKAPSQESFGSPPRDGYQDQHKPGSASCIMAKRGGLDYLDRGDDHSPWRRRICSCAPKGSGSASLAILVLPAGIPFDQYARLPRRLSREIRIDSIITAGDDPFNFSRCRFFPFSIVGHRCVTRCTKRWPSLQGSCCAPVIRHRLSSSRMSTMRRDGLPAALLWACDATRKRRQS